LAAVLVVQRLSGIAPIPLSSGEINFLWWFSQGSIMDVQVRRRLRQTWGMCDRHTAAWLSVEAAFRHGFMHGPAVMYTDLMERAVKAFDLGPGPMLAQRLARRLRSRAACHVCGMGLGPDSEKYVPRDRLDVGRDVSHIRAFMEETKTFWCNTVCGLCAGTWERVRCRAHLYGDIEQGMLSGLQENEKMIRRVAHHLDRFHESFRWESHGTDTAEDHAALISAAGWCGGWRGLIGVYAGGPN
jgi:hypothetical protein